MSMVQPAGGAEEHHHHPDYAGAMIRSSRPLQDHLRWLTQKDQLSQDCFLVGLPSSLRRGLAVFWCFRESRDFEYVALTPDTTESDLKQRREILPGGTSVFVNQAAVRAAIDGKILILEGLEHAERNVLPILNNLLENREMALEDGRFLMHPKQYDLLRAQGNPGLHNMIRVHPRFRVIALGVPVPPFPGNPLDPPLRSRFQSRVVSPLSETALAGVMAEVGGSASQVECLVTFAASLRQSGIKRSSRGGVEGMLLAFHQLPFVTEHALLRVAKLLSKFPRAHLLSLLLRVFPVAWESPAMLVGGLLARRPVGVM